MYFFNNNNLLIWNSYRLNGRVKKKAMTSWVFIIIMFFNWFSKNHVINITKDSNVHFIVLFCDRFERDNMMSKLSGQLDFRVSK